MTDAHTLCSTRSPLEPFLCSQGFLVLDGGLATELEAAGHMLDHALWSAKILMDQPRAVLDVHLSYLTAGADCIIGAGYQASPRGLRESGYSNEEIRTVSEQSVTVAKDARDLFLTEFNSRESAPSPIVAAGLGPFGAYLADGSEFRGRYGVSSEELRDFHAERLQILWQAEPDLLAIETLPDAQELDVLLRLLQDMDDIRAWISFSCADEKHLNDGTPLIECARACADVEQVLAVGVNCTPPRFLDRLIPEIRAGAPPKPVVVYPNSGEVYDGESRSWTGHSDPDDFGASARRWLDLGASIIGGCCRSRPRHIQAVRQALETKR